MNRLYLTNTTPIKFKFSQNQRTFKVVENIDKKLFKKGNYKLLKVTKVSISTIELVQKLSNILKIKEKDIGYAGLKDKHATTIQYLTIPKWVSLKKFKNSDNLIIEELGFCDSRLKIGELISNSFEIILEDVTKSEFLKLESSFNKIYKLGFANFFGYQRFGVLNDAVIKGKKISDIGKGVKNQKSKIIVAAYQSKMFNSWLNTRLEISKDIIEGRENNILKTLSPTLLTILQNSNILFKLLPGDLCYFYKGKRKNFITINSVQKHLKDFEDKKLYPTGVLFGNSVRLSNLLSKKIEKEYIDYDFDILKGARRAAWIWPKNASISYNNSLKEATLKFKLPPGSYATVLIEELLNSKIIP